MALQIVPVSVPVIYYAMSRQASLGGEPLTYMFKCQLDVVGNLFSLNGAMFPDEIQRFFLLTIQTWDLICFILCCGLCIG